jgi:hypothetical protein
VLTIDYIINFFFALATAVLAVIGVSLAITVAVIAITGPVKAAVPTTVCYIHHGETEELWTVPQAGSYSARYYVLQYTDTFPDPVSGGVTRPVWGYVYNMQGDQANLTGVTTGAFENGVYVKRITVQGFAQQHSQPTLHPEPQYQILRSMEFYGATGTVYPGLEEGWVATNNHKPNWVGYNDAGQVVRGVNDAPGDFVVSKVPCETLPPKPASQPHPGYGSVGYEVQINHNVKGIDPYR